MDMICRKTMMRCQTPGMCLPFQGCPDPVAQPLRDQLAAKDAEIAELRAKLAVESELLNTSMQMSADWKDQAERARRTAEYWKAEHNAANEQVSAATTERDEARECVKRLCEALTAIRDSTCTSATTLRGHAGVALAATPEHLRP